MPVTIDETLLPSPAGKEERLPFLAQLRNDTAEPLTSEVLALIGDPEKVDAEMADFRRSADTLSCDQPRLIDKYHKRWVAVVDGKVRADGRTVTELMREVDKKHLPRERTLVRFIDKNPRKFIL